ncbi:MAG TPA: hypothetical protein VGO52_10440 [Hyphomonadaceae bacterium]|jgi:membrane associated rhomboid family serine protease|nr:hypothetical protein [Hyphomonadaceae bacterium]
MSKRLGRFAVIVATITACAAALFVLPILFGATYAQSAVIVAVVFGALAAAWIVELMYRQAFPNLFRAFDKERQNRKVAGDGDK